MKSRRFIDRITVQVRSGKGGDGSKSFRREKYVEYGGPDGGDGGRGGHVIFTGDSNTDSLQTLYFNPLLYAKDGGNGRKQGMHGADGKDLIRKVPCGTEIFDNATGARLADITTHGQSFTAARGGNGGLGNIHFKTSTNQAPEKTTPGKPGQELELTLELKSIADAGLVGFPSAGKSSLLARLSHAQPKIAAYPFTTLNPIIGTLRFHDFSQVKIADIPGIIEGAHDGIGLGIAFLRHISRAKLLIFVIDMAGVDGREPWTDYRTLRNELKAYNPELLQRPFLVLANKMDLPGAKANLSAFKRKIRTVKPIPLSTADGTGIDDLKTRLHDLIQPLPKDAFPAPEPTEQPTEKPAPRGRAPTPATDDDEHDGSNDADIITPDKLRRASFLSLPAPRKTKQDKKNKKRSPF